MYKKLNSCKIINASLALLISTHAISAMEQDSSKDNYRYNQKRLQELGVIYNSALDEIQWVLKNYPLKGATERVHTLAIETPRKPVQEPGKVALLKGNAFGKDGVEGEEALIQVKLKELSLKANDEIAVAVVKCLTED